jgi:hypothetical protein
VFGAVGTDSARRGVVLSGLDPVQSQASLMAALHIAQNALLHCKAPVIVQIPHAQHAAATTFFACRSLQSLSLVEPCSWVAW